MQLYSTSGSKVQYMALHQAFFYSDELWSQLPLKKFLQCFSWRILTIPSQKGRWINCEISVSFGETLTVHFLKKWWFWIIQLVFFFLFFFPKWVMNFMILNLYEVVHMIMALYLYEWWNFTALNESADVLSCCGCCIPGVQFQW